MTYTCPLCAQPGGELLWQNALCRVVLIDEPGFPGFCRVILNRHVAEMTDLPPAERDQLMQVVYAVENALRATLAPTKINLASLGNQCPHLHWHVIPRWLEDSHFPASIWAGSLRPGQPPVSAQALNALRQALSQLTP